MRTSELVSLFTCFSFLLLTACSTKPLQPTLTQTSGLCASLSNPSTIVTMKGFRELGFPFRPGLGRFQSSYGLPVNQIKAFGIPDWGNAPAHNGVDLRVDTQAHPIGSRIPVYSPVNGTIAAIVYGPPNPEDSVMVIIQVEGHNCLFVAMALEPQSTPATMVHLKNPLTKFQGEPVSKGELVGYLIVGNDFSDPEVTSPRPTLDLRLLVIDSSRDTLKSVWKRVSETLEVSDPPPEVVISHNDLNDLPTFLCPYDHSDPDATSDYDSILQSADPRYDCTCACMGKSSTEKECGNCTD